MVIFIDKKERIGYTATSLKELDKKVNIGYYNLLYRLKRSDYYECNDFILCRSLMHYGCKPRNKTGNLALKL